MCAMRCHSSCRYSRALLRCPATHSPSDLHPATPPRPFLASRRVPGSAVRESPRASARGADVLRHWTSCLTEDENRLVMRHSSHDAAQNSQADWRYTSPPPRGNCGIPVERASCGDDWPVIAQSDAAVESAHGAAGQKHSARRAAFGLGFRDRPSSVSRACRGGKAMQYIPLHAQCVLWEWAGGGPGRPERKAPRRNR
jgi:hypothetical protein